MRALICVFSGTGNTFAVCKRLLKELSGQGVQADMYSIRSGAETPEIAGYDTLIIGYPVHAFNPPTPVINFLKRLPVAAIPAYLVRTSGEPLRLNDASGITPRRILRKRGYIVRGEYSYVMPYNIIFRHSAGMAARMWQAAVRRIKMNAREIAAGGGSLKKVNIFRRFVAFVLRIEHTAMPIMGRHFSATDGCVGCGACAALCPQTNISTEGGRPKFGKNCVGCMACSFGCPQDAIRISVLNGWRVNGGYSFEGEPAKDDEVCDYCKKAYLRYFHEAENLKIE